MCPLVESVRGTYALGESVGGNRRGRGLTGRMRQEYGGVIRRGGREPEGEKQAGGIKEIISRKREEKRTEGVVSPPYGGVRRRER